MLYEIYNGIYGVDDLPIAYLSTGSLKSLVVADIHLGFEEYMATKGVYIPRMQLNKAIDIIEKALNTVNVDTLIIVGDIKHLFDKLGRRETRDLHEFILYVKKRFNRVVLVRGNHDNFIYSLSQRYGIEFYETMEFGNILFVHGHKKLELEDNTKLIIMGHEHPSIALKDPVTESVTKLPCFLRIPFQNGSTAIVLPAAGAYQTGTSVSTSPESYLSPIIKRFGVLRDAKPFAIVENEGLFELPTLSAVEDLLAMF
ncbi:MAG: metallophosphoesterase [Ignisphaera sp.]